jgi:WD40 repeat protein
MDIQSRRYFMKNTFGWAILSILGLTSVNKTYGQTDNLLPQPLLVDLLPQPSYDVCTSVAFSHSSGRVVIAAGTFDYVKLYVNSIAEPNNFNILWAPVGDSSEIHTISWSPDDKKLAFTATVRINSNPKITERSLYVADVDAQIIRKLVKIEEIIGQEKHILANIEYYKNLAWYNDQTIIVADADGAILKVNQATGQIETFIPAQEKAQIHALAVTQSGELRVVRAKSDTDGDVKFNISGLKGGNITDYGSMKRKGDDIASAQFSPEGDFLFLVKWADGIVRTVIYDVNNRSILKEVPAIAQYGKNQHIYAPVAVRDKKNLILIEIILLDDNEGLPPFKRQSSKIVQLMI